MMRDSAGNDVFTAAPTSASMAAREPRPRSMGSKAVSAIASTGYDTATLSDSAGNDIFSYSSTVGYCRGAGFSNTATIFDKVTRRHARRL